jgi:hypothetical protein
VTVEARRYLWRVSMNVQPHTSRGAGLLLVHCAAVSEDRQSAAVRLEQALGGELARLLVFALVGRHGRRGSSSP